MNQVPQSGRPDENFLTFVDMASERSRASLGKDGSGLATPISLLIRRLNRRMAADSERLLPDGLSMANFRVCFTLWAAGPLEPHRVAQASLMSRAAVSAARKMLEAHQLVTAETSASDQRSIVLSLTPKGVALTEEIHAKNLAITEQYLAVLSPSEQHVLVGLLGKVADSSSASPSSPDDFSTM